ncbi:alkaline phosphatase family protein [Candidatus Sumerlaeota bacterium]|nr:alkaline phosphatase family protein [Candidatus Sumerlaeota bacterium]
MPSNRQRRLFVLSLDGVSCSFLERGIASGDFPHLGELARSARLRKIHSELPAVSSVAWTSFATGADPATHGVFGFVDRVASTGELFIPTARHRRAPTIWQRLSDQGRPAISINVPGVYPPDDIRGCVVAGFLCPSLDRATTRPDIARRLAEIGYVVDVDATLGRGQDKQPFIAALRDALSKRRDLALWLLDREPWDFFQLHIMETDRINHFLWDAHEDANHPSHAAFGRFYREVDALAGEIIARIRGEAAWMILSDHGFARTRAEVNVNALLRELGFLRYSQSDPPRAEMNLDAVEAGSRAFSLLPGRIYVNLAGRERRGSVPEELYEQVVAELAEALGQVKLDGPDQQPVCAFIARARDIYCGPLLGEACDLIAVGKDGLDLKAGFRAEVPFAPPSLAGVHTYDDAFVIASDVLRGDEAAIRDVGRRVHEFLL